MKIWIKCDRCQHQEHHDNVLSTGGDVSCPKCGYDKVSMAIGGRAPDWWRPEPGEKP